MIKRVFSVILSVLIFVSAFLTAFMLTVKVSISDYKAVAAAVVNDEFVSALYDDVKYSTARECDVLEVKLDTVMKYVTEDELKELSIQIFYNNYLTLFYGNPIERVKFSSEDLKKDIYNELKAFAEEQGIEHEDISYSADKTYELVLVTINSTLEYFTDADLNAGSRLSRVPGMQLVLGNGVWYACAAFILFVILKLIVMRKNPLAALYNVFFMSAIASSLCFLPVLIMKLDDISSRMIIAYSGYRVFAQNLVNKIIGDALTATLIVFAVTVVGFIVFMLLLARKYGRQAKELPPDEQ